ncbi:PRC-barrel domain-containing protein [Pelobacter seleniigenes]|uniref:PRC-barrel domain-containing protein n=1 Tax=Pelobacter seleniigenes TaxID=407188 RepID=UPI0004A6B36D|nr:PRC-barrel domain-containing protein [Pelobacter seleniigenes]
MGELRKLSDLTGYNFQASDGDIGRLEEVYFDDQRWQVRYLVVRTGSWLLGRQVLLLPAAVVGIDDKNHSIQVDLTQQQIKDAPPVDSEEPVSRYYQQQYHSYYDWEPYWTTDPLFQANPLILPLNQSETTEPENPHLRTSDEVSGYNLEAEGGSVGHVEDLILDDQTWTVRFLEIDTRNWLPGRHVLISPAWVEKIDWSKQRVQVKLSHQLVKSAPEYDSSQLVSREYQLALYKHYGKVFTD